MHSLFNIQQQMPPKPVKATNLQGSSGRELTTPTAESRFNSDRNVTLLAPASLKQLLNSAQHSDVMGAPPESQLSSLERSKSILT